MIGGAEEDRTPDPLRARQVLSQLSYDPLFLLRLFVLLFVMSTLSLSHILTYAPSLARTHASIKTKILAKRSASIFLSQKRFVLSSSENKLCGRFGSFGT